MYTCPRRRSRGARSPRRRGQQEGGQRGGEQGGHEQGQQRGPRRAPREGELLALEHVVERLVRLGRLLGGRGPRGGRSEGGDRRRGAPRRRRGGRRGRRGQGRGGRLLGAAHPEHQLHVVARAPAAYAPVQVLPRRRADEVVRLPRLELEPARLGAERAERDREEHDDLGLVADGDDPRVGVRDAARLVLLLGHVVDDVLFGVLVPLFGGVRGTDEVDLVELELRVALVQVEDVVGVVDAEDAVGGVPVDVVDLAVVGPREVEAGEDEREQQRNGRSAMRRRHAGAVGRRADAPRSAPPRLGAEPAHQSATGADSQRSQRHATKRSSSDGEGGALSAETRPSGEGPSFVRRQRHRH